MTRPRLTPAIIAGLRTVWADASVMLEERQGWGESSDDDANEERALLYLEALVYRTPMDAPPTITVEQHALAVQVLNDWARNGRTWYSGQIEVVGPLGEFRVALCNGSKSQFVYGASPAEAQYRAAQLVADLPAL
jgi:hypothetical protein